MKKQTPQIDLLKVKIGQQVGLRNGEILTFKGKSKSQVHPFLAGSNTYIRNGAFWCTGTSSYDIIKILPLTKKRIAKHMGKTVNIAENRMSPKREKTIRAAINLLEGLLK